MQKSGASFVGKSWDSDEEDPDRGPKATRLSRTGNDRLEEIRAYVGAFDPEAFVEKKDKIKAMKDVPAYVKKLLLDNQELRSLVQISVEAMFILKYQDHRYFRVLDNGQVAMMKGIRECSNNTSTAMKEVMVRSSKTFNNCLRIILQNLIFISGCECESQPHRHQHRCRGHQRQTVRDQGGHRSALP